MKGYIKVSREFLENEVLCKDAEHIGLYVYLLSRVSYTDNSYAMWNGKRVNLKIGQMVTSIRALAKGTGINQTKVTRILSLFKKWNILGTITQGRRTLVTIEPNGLSNLSLGTNLEQFWNDSQENKDEKEKSSKREKEERKEIKKKERNISPKSPYEEDFSTFDTDEFFQIALERSAKRIAERAKAH